MPRRKDPFEEGNFYHVFNRTLPMYKLCYSHDNYQYLIKLIKKYKQKYNMSIITYCLMPNHYHFLIRQGSEISISKFVGGLFNTYVQALNIQQKQSGSIFEDRFKHIYIDKDDYLLHLCRYIHLNPVAANLVKKTESWLYSDYAEWMELYNCRKEITEFRDIHFKEPSGYMKFVYDYKISEEFAIKLTRYYLD